MGTSFNHTLSPTSAGLSQYLQSVFGAPELTEEQEQQLFTRYRIHHDLDAVKELILSHLRYVVYISRQYAGYGMPEEDLIQEGNVGLMKSIKHFDPSRGLRLRHYAAYWIKAEILEFIVRRWRMVKVATTKEKRKLFFRLRQAKKRLAWLSAEETDAIANELGVDADCVQEMDSHMYSQDSSVLTTDVDEEYEENSLIIEDDSWSPEHSVAHDEIERLTYDGLVESLKSLDYRSREIVEQRWLAVKKETLEALADRFEISAERVRQIEKQALNKMRAHFDVEAMQLVSE